MLPGESAEAALAEIRALCDRLRAADDEQWQVTVTPVIHVSAGEIDAHAPIVKTCQAAHRAVTGRDADISSTAGFEDAHFLLDAGIPTAMFGPYRSRQASEDPQFTPSGMADESVDLVDVARAAEIYARLITDLLG